MIKISELSQIHLEEGQKVLVCEGVKGDIISQRTGKRMGKREKVVASGVITIQNGKSFIKTTEPINISGEFISTPHNYMCRHPYKHKQVGL